MPTNDKHTLTGHALRMALLTALREQDEADDAWVRYLMSTDGTGDVKALMARKGAARNRLLDLIRQV